MLITFIEIKFDARSIYNRNVLPDYTKKNIIIEITPISGEINFNPEELLMEVTAKFEIALSAVEKDSSNLKWIPVGEKLLDDIDIAHASVIKYEDTKYGVQM